MKVSSREMTQIGLPVYSWLSRFLLATPGGWLGKAGLRKASGIRWIVFNWQYHEHKTTSGISHGLQMVSGLVEGGHDSTGGYMWRHDERGNRSHRVVNLRASQTRDIFMGRWIGLLLSTVGISWAGYSRFRTGWPTVGPSVGPALRKTRSHFLGWLSRDTMLVLEFG